MKLVEQYQGTMSPERWSGMMTKLVVKHPHQSLHHQPRGQNRTGRGTNLLTVDKGNDLPGSSTDLPQSATETLSSVGDRRTSRRSDAGETLGGLRGSRGGSLTGL